MNEFELMNVSNAILKALLENNIEDPTEIQKEAIPLLMGGNDVIGQAQTGTGKTFAYAIPMLEKLDEKSNHIQALIMCPTRELSIQVGNEIGKIAKYTKFKYAVIYGGESYETQFKALAKKPQIMIGTPGRIIDHLKRGSFTFEHISYLVLDEADEMLKMGFQEDMKTILEGMPSLRQTALFSATLPPFILSLSEQYMFHPQMVKIKTKSLTVDKIKQFLYYVKREQKKDLLLRILDYYQFQSVMIFANTKSKVDELMTYLQLEHFKADGLHGDLKQNNRDRVMQAFRLGSIEILVATDVAARGIDVSGIEAIINYDLPLENELYVHRIGRTGRAGLEGTAISFASPREKMVVESIEKYTKTKMSLMEIPSVKAVETKRQKRLTDKILAALPSAEQNHSYDVLLAKIAEVTTDPTPVIVSLLTMLDESVHRSYARIDPVTVKKISEKKPVKQSYVAINIGSSDKVRPNQLVVFLHDQLKIHREHFGKIVVSKNETCFELAAPAIPYLKNISRLKWNGKKLAYHMTNKMPRGE